MPLDVFYEVRRAPSARRLDRISNHHLRTDRILYASLGLTPYLSCIQALSIHAYDEEFG